MLAQNPGYDACDMWGGEAVARGCEPFSVLPGYAYIDAWRAKFYRRMWVIVENKRVFSLVRRYRNDRGIDRWETGDRHVISRGYQHYITEVGQVGQFVQQRVEVFFGRSQAQIAGMHAVLDGPAQAGCKDRAAPAQSFSQYLDAIEFAIWGKRADDTGAGSAMPIRIPMRRGIEQHTFRFLNDSDVAAQGSANSGVRSIDSAIDHGHLDPLAGASFPGPFTSNVIKRQDRSEFL